MSFHLNDEGPDAHFIPIRVSQLASDLQGATCAEEKAWRKTLRKIISFIHGHTAVDALELKKLGMRKATAMVRIDEANAEAKLAEAEKSYAEAAESRARAYATRNSSAAEMMLKQVEAIERLEAAMSKIRQMGGEVAFDSNELKSIVKITQAVETTVD